MRFSQPAYLLLLVLIGWCWHVARSSPAMRSRGSLGARLVVVALLVLGAAGLQLRGGEEPISVVFVLDRSDSMAGAASIQRINELTAGARAGDREGVIVFGAEAVVEQRLGPVRPVREIASEVVGSATNIETAVRLARATLPREGARRIVLLSDGRETAGRASAEAAHAAAEGIPVDIVEPPGPDATPSARIASVSAPPSVRAGEPFAVLAEVEGPPRTRVDVLFQRNQEPWESRQVLLPDSGRTVVAFHDQHRTTGVHTYRATIGIAGDGDDSADSENGAGAVVSVAGKTTVLYVSAGPGLLTRLLGANDFDVEEVHPSSMPNASAALTRYDAIVLDDVAPAALNAAQSGAIAQHVEQRGGGLLVLGSERSLEGGSVMEGPLGPILPIDLRPRSGRRSPAIALVVVFDKSGSMADTSGGVPKIEIARQAVGKVLGVLPPTDALGVIAFDAAPVTVAPLAGGHDTQTMAARLRSVEAAGATRIAPAMQRAREWLQSPAASAFAKRHVLLVSDGRTTADDATRVDAAVRGAGFELSVVALGPESDRRLLARLAAATGGRAYFPDDLSQLPVILAREASRVAGGRLVQARFALRASAHPAASGLEQHGLPQMEGYVVSASKPTAETVLRSHLDDPILGTWRVGLGRVAAFTADLRGSWSADMRAWSGFAPLWVQSLRWLSRTTDTGGLHVRFEPAAGQMQLVIEAEEPSGRFLNLVDGHAYIRTPTGETIESALRHVAPGRYEASIALKEAGPYTVVISARHAARAVEERVVRGFYWSADAEQRHRGADLAALRQLADATGGVVLKAGQSPFGMNRTATYVELWPWLTAAALLLFVLEILARRYGLAALSSPSIQIGAAKTHADRYVA